MTVIWMILWYACALARNAIRHQSNVSMTKTQYGIGNIFTGKYYSNISVGNTGKRGYSQKKIKEGSLGRIGGSVPNVLTRLVFTLVTP